jgi:hypothetical protein
MKNILSSLSKEEKRRILEMHVNASKRNYLSESEINPSNVEKVGIFDIKTNEKVGGIDMSNIKYEGNPEKKVSDYVSFDYTYAGSDKNKEKSRGQYFCKDKVIQILNKVEYYQLTPDNSKYNEEPNAIEVSDVESKRYKLSPQGDEKMEKYCVNEYASNNKQLDNDLS